MLNGSRQVGFAGPLGIPLSEVETYCRLAAIPAASRLAFAALLTLVDDAFLNLIETRKARKVAQPKG